MCRKICNALLLRYADILQQQFNKRYSFPDGPASKPSSSDPYKAPYWRDSRLQSMKERLNATKSKLNEMPLNKWHKHTKKLNPAGTVTQELKKRAQPELMTQAWQKFYECFQVLRFSNGCIVNSFSSVPRKIFITQRN